MGALKGQLLALPETLSYSLDFSGSSPVGDQLFPSVLPGAAGIPSDEVSDGDFCLESLH